MSGQRGRAGRARGPRSVFSPEGSLVLLLAAGLLLTPVSSALAQEETIAVWDFEGRGISEVEASVFTDMLRSELVRRKAFRVVERQRMEQILAEQGFQLSGCTTDECLVQMGRLLNVRRVVSGSIGQFGNIYTAVCDIINVESGEIEDSFNDKVSGSMDELVSSLLPRLAERISSVGSGTAPPPRQGPAEEVRYGDGQTAQLRVRTNPAGATVMLDGSVVGKTPLTRKGVATGPHTVVLTREGYRVQTHRVVVEAVGENELSSRLHKTGGNTALGVVVVVLLAAATAIYNYAALSGATDTAYESP